MATYLVPGFYVVDEMSHSPMGILDDIVDGPYSTAAFAHDWRKSLNIADDCSVYYLNHAANVMRRVDRNNNNA